MKSIGIIGVVFSIIWVVAYYVFEDSHGNISEDEFMPFAFPICGMLLYIAIAGIKASKWLGITAVVLAVVNLLGVCNIMAEVLRPREYTYGAYGIGIYLFVFSLVILMKKPSKK